MNNQIRNWLKKGLQFSGLLPYFSMFQLKSTYLDPLGWSKSILLQRPMKNDGSSVPWMNYSAIQLIEGKVKSKTRVLEYGSGASTRWWAGMVSSVLAIEHDKLWYEQCKKQMPANVELRLAASDASYPSTASAQDGPFDIVVIDALFRNECAEFILSWIDPKSVIIWDDSERIEFQPMIRKLQELGYRQIRLFGPKPGASKPAATDFFYKDGNALGL